MITDLILYSVFYQLSFLLWCFRKLDHFSADTVAVDRAKKIIQRAIEARRKPTI